MGFSDSADKVGGGGGCCVEPESVDSAPGPVYSTEYLGGGGLLPVFTLVFAMLTRSSRPENASNC